MTHSIYVDYLLAVFGFLAACVQIVSIAIGPRRNFYRYLVGAGWVLLTVRLWSQLCAGEDPAIAPISQIALMLLAAGAILRALLEPRR